MELYEREFFIAKIFRGYIKHKVDKDIYIYINPPSLEEYIESQEVLMEAYEEATEEGVMSPDECLSFMMDNGIWGIEKEKEIKELESGIEKLKVKVFKSFFSSEKREEARGLLNRSKERLAVLHHLQHSYDHVTTVGVATYAKNAWVIENCTTYKDGSLYDWKHMDIQKAMSIQNNSIISEETIRELANSHPWQGYWALKGEGENIFRKHPLEMTFNQHHIVSWAGAYSNVHESMECPVKAVIEDNDAFDGWMIDQRETREKDKGEKFGEKLTEKHKDANEVFVFAPTKEDAERVDELNDPAAQMVKRQRMYQVDTNAGVEYQQFNDVKRTLVETSHEMQKNRNK
ncbi:hypothetical protein CMO96_02005 [Candidatus Woesebacteria bacterium]|nr:hypothetical protein [Candidatus Woesebacteria bacterium]